MIYKTLHRKLKIEPQSTGAPGVFAVPAPLVVTP